MAWGYLHFSLKRQKRQCSFATKACCCSEKPDWKDRVILVRSSEPPTSCCMLTLEGRGCGVSPALPGSAAWLSQEQIRASPSTADETLSNFCKSLSLSASSIYFHLPPPPLFCILVFFTFCNLNKARFLFCIATC